MKRNHLISKESVRTAAKLASIRLTEEEEERYAVELLEILKYFRMLDELDTEGIDPSASAAPLEGPLRDDEPEPSFPRKQMLDNAPHIEKGCYRVPRVME